MLKHIIKIKDRIYALLQAHESTRESDKLLWLAYMCQYHGLRDTLGPDVYSVFKQWLLHEDVPPHESIRRVRAEIQSAGHFRGKNYKERRGNAKDVYDHFAIGSGGDGSGKARDGLGHYGTITRDNKFVLNSTKETK